MSTIPATHPVSATPLASAAREEEKRISLESSVEEVAQAILEIRTGHWKTSDSPADIDRTVREKNEFLSRYLMYEKFARKGNPILPSPLCGVKLDYRMSPEEMKTAITEKFQKMFESGELVYERDIAERRVDYHPPQNETQTTRLDQIWGAQALQEILPQTSNFFVPRKILVISDDCENITVTVASNQGDHFLIPTSAENTYVLTEMVEGEPAANTFAARAIYDESALFTFADFAGPPNIIRTAAGRFGVVDTEYNSFNKNPGKDFQDFNNRRRTEYREYLQHRTELFNPKRFPIKITISIQKVMRSTQTPGASAAE